MTEPARYYQVITTVDSEEAAHQLAKLAVERRLAACAQVLGPIQSTYRWQGEIERAKEWLLQLKTRADLYLQLEQALRERHPYTVPEILAFPVAAGNPAYLGWLTAELLPPPDPRPTERS